MKAQHWKVYMIHMTRGERGNPMKKPDEYSRQLESEMKRCAEALGAECIWMGYLAGQIPEDRIAVRDLCDLFRKIKADAVITHWQGSYHPRHVQTCRAVTQAVFRMPDESYRTGAGPYALPNLWFGENMEDEEGFVPEFYLDSTDVYEKWFEALKAYQLFREGVTGFPYQSFYAANTRLRGVDIGVKYAKALMHRKALIGDLSIRTFEVRLSEY